MELFDLCKHCKGLGYVGDYEPCPKCHWEPQKLNEQGLALIEFLDSIKVHMEVPKEWY